MSEQEKEHKERHIQLYQMLDELIGDYFVHTGKLPGNSTVLELVQWSVEQRDNPTAIPADTQLQVMHGGFWSTKKAKIKTRKGIKK